MGMYENQVLLSESILLEYDKLPSGEQCDDIWNEDIACAYIEKACVNGQNAKLFSICNIKLIIEYIISEHSEFSQFLNLRDILLPDVDLYMYYNTVNSYNDICYWMEAMIRQLIIQGDIIPFSRSKLTVQTVEGFDDDTVFAVKCDLARFNQEVTDKIILKTLSDCTSYRIALDKDDAIFETDIMDDLSLSEAIKIAKSIPGLINETLSFFSFTSNVKPYHIYVSNNTSNKVLEMNVLPDTESTNNHHDKVYSTISSEALPAERYFILAKKKAHEWEYRDIDSNLGGN